MVISGEICLSNSLKPGNKLAIVVNVVFVAGSCMKIYGSVGKPRCPEKGVGCIWELRGMLLRGKSVLISKLVLIEQHL